MQTVAHLGLNALNSFTVFNLFDDGLADLLCLKTHLHGTSPRNYLNIIREGALPSFGGQPSMGYTAFLNSVHFDSSSDYYRSDRKFHVLKDDYYLAIERATGCFSRPIAGIVKTFTMRLFAIFAGIGELHHAEKESCMRHTMEIVGGIFLGLFSPILKFRFAAGEKIETQFKERPSSRDGRSIGVFYTEEAISPDHIGLYATATKSGGWIGRIENDPRRFVKGLVELILSVSLTALLIIGMIYSPTMLLVGGIFLTYESALFLGRIIVPLVSGAISPLPEV